MKTVLARFVVLGLAGAAALGVGLALMLSPAGFYAHYQIEIGADPSLRNEFRAVGGVLAVLGAMILSGAFYPAWTRISAGLGAAVFLSLAFGRFLSLALDGAPVAGLMEAAAIEVVIGALCAWLSFSAEPVQPALRRLAD